ncbi:SDR family NAD(P)-dependent oxidoreductase [Dongshaea marina]|uniref:SDR family NAD(P)-dependent oxidoreductase n=1 Tax=Dongshaea marina TaxID=2047966 RepID=UPI00131F127D|nr:SDR family oxidoreductase [Dongshaea marina]
MNHFQDKVVIVTGGGSGIGKATAEAFVKQGAKVLISGRRIAPLKTLSEAHPGKISYIQADVTQADDRKQIVQSAIDNYGQLDILVNNAGIFTPAPLLESTDDDFNRVYQTNVLAPAALIREAAPHLEKTKGSVVNVSSIVGRAAMQGMCSYGASKAALDYLTRTCAIELGPMGIRVNAIAPGVTQTDMAENIVKEQKQMFLAMTPMGRLGQSDDIAQAILMLASKNAGWVTGQIVDASGGMLV